VKTDSRYELVRVLGSGGMAEVIEAIQHGTDGFNRRVAIKRLSPEYVDDDEMQRMFLDEARIASQLHQANIVQVIDYGTVEGAQFIVMEHIDGLTASAAARAGARRGRQVPPTTALHIASEIAHALHYAHGRHDTLGAPLGIVHRDVSPTNILLSWDGDVKLADFGIALATSRETRTQTGFVKGKEHFMSPEQARGAALDGSADIYALGATLHWLLSGSPMLSGSEGQQAVDVAEPLRRVIEHATAAEPHLRPSATEMVAECSAARQALEAGDGRMELRQWLSGLRETQSGQKGRAGAFDRLLGVCLVRSAEDPHEFTVDRPKTATKKPTTPLRPVDESKGANGGVSETAPEGVSETAPEGVSETAPEGVGETFQSLVRRSRQRFVLAVSFVLAGTVVGVMIWLSTASPNGASGAGVEPSAAIPDAVRASQTARTTGGEQSTKHPVHEGNATSSGNLADSLGGSTSRDAAASRTAVAADATSAGSEADPSHAVGTPSDSTTRGAAPGVSPPQPMERRSRPKRRRSKRSAAKRQAARQKPSLAEPAGPASQHGWLRVGGAALLRGLIYVDGARRGRAPAEIRLSCGAHQIVVHGPSGDILVSRQVIVREDHRRASPLRIIMH
jgi:serine/threonine protein kinase